MADSLKAQIKDAMKAAMRAKEKARLGTIRLIQSEIKRIEVDERIDVDDARLLTVLDKMTKQRRESIRQFEAGARDDLIAIESAEIEIIQEFLPSQLSDDEIGQLVNEAVNSSGAESMKDMGKVMGLLKPKLQGRADMGKISQLIKSRLTSA
jgi:uncharacterized protein YqeY